MSDDPRLPWRRYHDGFLAHPEGAARPTRVAAISRASGGGAPWQWRVQYDAAVSSGAADTAQLAADAATAAWTWAKGEAPRLEASAAAELELEVACAVAAEDGDATPLQVESAPYDRLLRANWHLRRHLESALRRGGSTPAVEAVLRVISDELAARRRSK